MACDREDIDKFSGNDTNRPQLQAMIRESDIINVHSMDRLARNVQDLLSLIDTVINKGAKYNSIKKTLLLTDAFQKLMLTC